MKNRKQSASCIYYSLLTTFGLLHYILFQKSPERDLDSELIIAAVVDQEKVGVVVVQVRSLFGQPRACLITTCFLNY